MVRVSLKTASSVHNDSFLLLGYPAKRSRTEAVRRAWRSESLAGDDGRDDWILYSVNEGDVEVDIMGR